MRDLAIFLAGLWLGAGLSVVAVLMLASGQPRHPEGKTWQRT